MLVMPLKWFAAKVLTQPNILALSQYQEMAWCLKCWMVCTKGELILTFFLCWVGHIFFKKSHCVIRWPQEWQQQLMEMPIGLVPGGSGNALNCSVLHQLDQPLDGVNNLGAKHSAMNVALGAKAHPLLTSKHARSFNDIPFPITSADSPGRIHI